jgi:hypothetical protein
MEGRILRFAAVLVLGTPLTNAQWLNYPSANAPRLQDGKVNLAAPAPRAAGGHPDLSGIWATADGKYLENPGVDGAGIAMLP